MTSHCTPEQRRAWRQKKLAEDPEYFKKKREQFKLRHPNYAKERYAKIKSNPITWERTKAYRKQYFATHKSECEARWENWRKNNLDKFNAKTYAIRYSPKKDKCEQCNSTERLERHHPDYTKPTETLTLCKDCHEALHKKLKAEGKQPDIDLAAIVDRHCHTCGKSWPSCGRTVKASGKSPNYKGKKGCAIWIPQIIQITSTEAKQ